jgi:hypothetical protein
MSAFLRHLIGWIIILFRSRPTDLILENLALRQQYGRLAKSLAEQNSVTLGW